ncbi:MAG: DUF5681 domain-containing protein [Candidatus Acidiferrales bacterium]
MSKNSNRKSREGNEGFAPATRVQAKGVPKRPRGRAFPKGHTIGIATRFIPGVSGNPTGRPQGAAEISKALRTQLASDLKIPARTYAEKVARKWLEESLRGNIAAIVSLSNRVEGTPVSSVYLDGSGDNFATYIAMHVGQRGEDGEIVHPEGWQPPLELTSGEESEQQ